MQSFRKKFRAFVNNAKKAELTPKITNHSQKYRASAKNYELQPKMLCLCSKTLPFDVCV